MTSVVAGLGGRPVTATSVSRLLWDVVDGALPEGVLHFLDLDKDLVARELQRVGKSGPHAQNMIRDLGVVGASPQ